jgi:hypothetical protein
LEKKIEKGFVDAADSIKDALKTAATHAAKEAAEAVIPPLVSVKTFEI